MNRLRRLAQLASFGLGLLAVGWTLAYTDFGALRRFGGWAVLVVVLEGARIGLEAIATRALHGTSVRVPWAPLLRAHAAGFAIANTMPAGRPLAETAKAVLLAPWATGARSAGVAAANQAMVLLSAGLLSITWALFARGLGQSTLALSVGVQGVAVVALGLALLAVVSSRPLGRWVSRRFPSTAEHVEGVSAGARLRGVPVALACFTAHRAIQAAQIFVLLGALGRWDLPVALALAGAAILGTTVGVVTPGQIGAVGGSLALAAPGMGVAVPQALAIALVLHAAQFAWAAVGYAVWTLSGRLALPIALDPEPQAPLEVVPNEG